jgi:hypothetical protein
MPRVRRRIDSDATYEAWAAFAADEPPNTLVHTGDRLRGDHPVVQQHPHWFVEAGSAPHTWPSQLGTTEPPPPPTYDIKLTVEPRPLEGAVEATKDIKVLLDNSAVTLATGGLPGRLITTRRAHASRATASSPKQDKRPK